MSVKVKICGVTSVEDARAAVEAGADLVGLNFVPESPRRVTLERARAVAGAAAGAVVVGVFADASADEVRRIVDAVGLDMLQFHGAEPEAFCRGWDRPVIKAVRAPNGDELARRAGAYEDVAYLLVDAWVPGRIGGTGVALDPEVATVLDPARLFIAGGLTVETVGPVVARLRPFAVDVASGVESSPGVKDHAEIERFVRRAKAA